MAVDTHQMINGANLTPNVFHSWITVPKFKFIGSDIETCYILGFCRLENRDILQICPKEFFSERLEQLETWHSAGAHQFGEFMHFGYLEGDIAKVRENISNVSDEIIDNIKREANKMLSYDTVFLAIETSIDFSNNLSDWRCQEFRTSCRIIHSENNKKYTRINGGGDFVSLLGTEAKFFREVDGVDLFIPPDVRFNKIYPFERILDTFTIERYLYDDMSGVFYGEYLSKMIMAACRLRSTETVPNVGVTQWMRSRGPRRPRRHPLGALRSRQRHAW